MLIVVLELLLIVVFSWMIRSAFTIPAVTMVLSDSFAHLFMIKAQQGHRFFNFRCQRSVIDTNVGYPKLQHFLISRFPEARWMQIGGILTIAYDLVWIVLFYVLLLWKFPAETVQATPSFAFWGANIFFSTTPILLPNTARLTGLGNSRTLGGLLHFCLIVSWLLIPTSQLVPFVIATVVFVLLIVWSSSFGLQAAIFNSIFLSLLMRDATPVLAVAATLVVIFALPIGAREILTFKVRHWIWYFQVANRRTTAAGRNSPREFLRLPWQLFCDRRAAGSNIFAKLTPIIAAYSIPAAIIVLVRFCDGARFNEGSEVVHYSSLVFLSSLITFALISLPWFAFLGQAERYFEYSAPFLIVLVLDLVARGELAASWLSYLLLMHLSAIWMVFLYRNRSYQNHSMLDHSRQPNVREVVGLLAGNPDREWRILTVPFKAANFWGYLNHDANNVSFFHFLTGLSGSLHEMKEQVGIDDLNLPCDDLSLFQQRYSINSVLVHKFSASHYASYVARYHLDQQNLMLENEDYALYELNGLNEAMEES